jgi:hypothetical protein
MTTLAINASQAVGILTQNLTPCRSIQCTVREGIE